MRIYYAKRQVENSLPLRIKSIKPYLKPGFRGWSRWGEHANISWYVDGDPPAALILEYSKSGQPFSVHVPLVTTPTPWGALRYWFSCPHCGRRCGVLYLPGGESIFACRICHNLAYRSNQEEHSFDSALGALGAGMGGYSAADIRYILGDSKRFPRGGRLAQDVAQRLAELERQVEAARLAVTHPGYLTAAELCERSGLTPDNLAALGAARLLLPDTKDGRYRPKLSGWAGKLAYLLGAGWALAELQAWARGRWSTPNPRLFPPDRAAWALGDHLEGGQMANRIDGKQTVTRGS